MGRGEETAGEKGKNKDDTGERKGGRCMGSGKDDKAEGPGK